MKFLMTVIPPRRQSKGALFRLPHPNRTAVRRAILLSLLPLLLLLPACRQGMGGDRVDRLAYQQESFCLAVRGELWGAPFAGELTHTTEAEGIGEQFRLRFTAPTALAGICYTVTAQGEEVSLGGIVLPTDSWQTVAWRDVIALIRLVGEPISVTETAEQVTAVYARTDGGHATLTWKGNGKYPAAIETDGIWIEVEEN